MILKNAFNTPFGFYARTILEPDSGLPLTGILTHNCTGAVRVLSETNALGFDDPDEAATITALADARAGRLPVEVRVGVGPLLGALPARVIPYAAYVARAVADAALIAGKAPRIEIFSSAPKSRVSDPESIALSLAALGLALRSIQGLQGPPIRLSRASPLREVPDLAPRLPEPLQSWLRDREKRYSETARPDLDYGFEHAAASMFGDLSSDQVLRITVGGANEGRFWAIRTAVREAARLAGLPVVPALALIFPALRIPWYTPTNLEPAIRDFQSWAQTREQLDRAANPKTKGNTGLNREARVFASLKDFDFERFVSAVSHDAAHALMNCDSEGIEVSEDLAASLGE